MSCPWIVTLEPLVGDVRRYDCNTYLVQPDKIPRNLQRAKLQDEAHKLHIYRMLANLPLGQQRRFQRWYVRHIAKKAGVKDQTFDSLAAIFYTDCRKCVRSTLKWNEERLRQGALRKEASRQNRRPKMFVQRNKPVKKDVQQHIFPESEWNITHDDWSLPIQAFALTSGQVIDRVKKILFNRRVRKAEKSLKGVALRWQKEVLLHQYHNDLWYWTDDGCEYRAAIVPSEIGWGMCQMMEEDVATETSTANITFEDEKVILENSAHVSGSVTLPDSNACIAENKWNINSVLTREYPIKEFEWKTSDVFKTAIVDVGLPKAITDQSKSLITRQLSFFAFARMGVKIRVQLNGTKFHCGRLVVYLKPLSWVNDVSLNRSSVFSYAHAFLDASISNSVILEFPFTHLHSYFAQCAGMIKDDGMNALGSLQIRALNTLKAGTGASQILSGTVYMSLVAPELHQPIHGVDKFSYGSGTMQGLLDSVVAKGKSLMGWNNQVDGVSAIPIINRSNAPLCHGLGCDRSIRLGLAPQGNTVTTSDVLGTNGNDFSLRTLCQVPSLIKKITWTDTQTAGTLLYYFPVTPVFIDSDFISSSPDPVGGMVTYNPSMLAYVSRAFCYFRGSLKLKVQFISTAFHSGRIAFVFDPHGSADLLDEDFDENKCNNIVIFDLQQEKEIVIDLPYFAIKPWLRCDHFRSTFNVKQTSPSVRNKVYLDSDIMGMFRVYVLGRLVHPANISSSIDINLYLMAGDDFELSVPNVTSQLFTNIIDEHTTWRSLRYPYCKATKTKLCVSTDYIYDIWYDGLKMYRRDYLGDVPKNAPSQKFVYSKIKKDTLDTLTWKQKALGLIDNSGDACQEYIKKLPLYNTVEGTLQMLSMASTRDQEGAAVTITHGHQVVNSVASRTLSENAMDIKTVMRRFYPLYISPTFRHDHAFTLISVPVSPSFTISEADSSTALEASAHRSDHLLAYLSRVFVYHRGSMRYKVLVRAPCTDIYVWHAPTEAQGFKVTSGFAYEQICEQLNFAGDVAVSNVQQGLEVEIPFYSTYNQLLHRKVRHTPDLRSQNGTFFIAVRNTQTPFSVSIFVSTGSDFQMNLLRAAPLIYEPWTKEYTDDASFVRYPDFARSTQYISSNVQIPGSFVFNQAANGAIGECGDIKNPAPPKENKVEPLADEPSEDILEFPLSSAEVVETNSDIIVPNTSIITPILPRDVNTSHMDIDYIRSLKQKVVMTAGEMHAIDEYERRHGAVSLFRAGGAQVWGLAAVDDAANTVSTEIERIRQVVEENLPPVAGAATSLTSSCEFMNSCIPELLTATNKVVESCDKVCFEVQAARSTGNDTAAKLVRDAHRVADSIEFIKAASVKHEQAATMFGEACSETAQTFKQINCLTNTFFFGNSLCILLELFTEGFSLSRILSLMTSLCYLFELSPTQVAMWLVNIFTAATPAQANEGQMQMFDCDFNLHDSFTCAIAAIATVIYTSVFGGLPTWDMIKKCIRNIMESGSPQGIGEYLRSVHFSTLGLKSLNQVYEFFMYYAEKVVSYILGKDSKTVLIEKEFKERSDEVLAWIEAIENADDDDYLEQVFQNVDCHNELFTLVDRGKEYTRLVVEGKLPPSLRQLIRDANRRLDEIVQRWKKARPGMGYRYSPMSVLLSGPAGTGKSRFSAQVVDIIADVLKLPAANREYSVPARDKFLSGYTAQPIVVWDDMLQNTEQDELATEFIQWCSTVDARLTMADLPDKGKLFKSKALVLTSNVQYPHLDKIRNRIAFLRRRHVHIAMEYAEGWDANRMLETRDFDDNFSHVQFVLMHPIDEQVIKVFPNIGHVKSYIAMKMIEWDIKQRKDIETYLQSHESLRLPKGVILTVRQKPKNTKWRWWRDTDGVVRFYRADDAGNFVVDNNPEDIGEYEDIDEVYPDPDRYFVGDYELRIQEGLTEEEQVDAEMVIDDIQNNPGVIEAIYDTNCEKVKKICKKWYQLAKRKVVAAGNSVKDKVKLLHEKYPYLFKTMALITTLGVGGMLLSKFWDMRGNKCVIPESDKKEAAIFKMPVTQVISSTHEASNLISEGLFKDKLRCDDDVLVAESAVYNSTVRVPNKVITIEGAADKSALDIARNKLYPAMAMFGWEKGGVIARLLGVCIGGKVVLLPRHFFMAAKEGDFFFFVRGKDKIQVEYVAKNCVPIREKDACLYYIGARFDSKSKIVQCFATESEMQQLTVQTPALLLGMTGDGVLREAPCVAKANARINYPVFGGYHYMMTGWEYPIDTVPGDCGSLLIACTNKLSAPRKIIGMHTAGFNDQRGGFSVILTQEQISEAIEVLHSRFGQQVFPAAPPKEVNGDPQIFEDKVKIIPEGHFTLLGVMDATMCPSQPMKTVLRPTPFQGEIGPVGKAPAILKPVNGISPLRNALKKYGKITVPFKNAHVNSVSCDILNDLIVLPHDMPAKVVTLKEAVFGIPGLAYCEKMNMNSSPGWPYQVLPNHRGQKGKAYLFGDEDCPIVDRFLSMRVEERENAAKAGMRVASIWRDCLKDELRPLSKIEAVKTRLFTIAPVDFTILVRKYFLAFEQCFYANYSRFFSAVGINPESYDWTRAYNRLLECGHLCVAGDFGTFDGTLFPELIQECGNIINEWYKFHGEVDEEARIVRRVLIDEIIHTHQLVQNCVYSTHQGNPSGNPLTVIINTMVNAFYMRLAWMEIMDECDVRKANMISYHDHVREEMYGDDNRLTIIATVLDVFNQVTITECLARHGIEYTDEGKTGNIVAFRDLKDTSFLKRKYRFDDEIGKDIALPVMDEETIIALTNWYRDGPDVSEQLRANQRSALGFAFFHGRAYFDDYNSKFSKCLIDNNIKPLTLTYNDLLKIFVGDVRDNSQNFIDFVGINFK